MTDNKIPLEILTRIYTNELLKKEQYLLEIKNCEERITDLKEIVECKTKEIERLKSFGVESGYTLDGNEWINTTPKIIVCDKVSKGHVIITNDVEYAVLDIGSDTNE